MATTAFVAFQFGQQSGIASGVAVNSIQVTITPPSGAPTIQSLAANATGTSFAIPQTGTYTVVIQPLNATGGNVGNPVTQTVNNPGSSTETLTLPVGATITTM
jgi:hypothetical protein